MGFHTRNRCLRHPGSGGRRREPQDQDRSRARYPKLAMLRGARGHDALCRDRGYRTVSGLHGVVGGDHLGLLQREHGPEDGELFQLMRSCNAGDS